MKRELLAGAFFVLLAGLVAFAFSEEGAKALHPAPDAKALIEKLSSEDYAVRAKAEEELVRLGEQAVPALEEAAKEHPDTHVRFAAERILHRIRNQGARRERPLAERRIFRRLRDGIRDLDELLRDFADDFGREIEERIREFEERHGEDLERRGDESRVRCRVKGVVERDGERLEYERDETGRVTVKITRDGKTTTFEADSLQALKKEHPDAYEKVKPYLGEPRGLGGRFGFGFDSRPGFGFRFRFPPLPELPPELPPLPREGKRVPGGFRLGIWVGEVGETLRFHLKLSPDEGILVEEVVPGSLADRMGIERFDVIRTVNGEKVACAEDVRRVIGPLAPGAEVTIELLRRGEPLKLHAKR